MEMRGGFMPRPPRDRGGMMRPGFPFRGRGVMLMDRARLGPPRPLIRGVPPFVGRGMLPPARHRGLGPVMIPRLPPPGALGPLGHRGLLPRPMLPPPRALHPDMLSLPEPGNILLHNDDEDESAAIQENIGQNANQANINRLNRGAKSNLTQNTGNRKTRKDTVKTRRVPTNQPAQSLPQSHHVQTTDQSPVQSSHTSPLKQNAPQNHQMQQSSSQQNVVCINQSPMQKHTSPMQTSMNSNISSQTSPLQISQATRGGRGGMNQRNRGNTHVGHGGIPSNPPSVGMNQVHVMNQGGLNVPVRGVAPVPPRPNMMMNGPPPPQYAGAPPSTNYPAPPPVMAPQMPIKRRAPPPPHAGPPVMQPKRVRYEPPPPSNGYMPYQQQQQQPPPPSQQPMYQSYDVPPPTDMYNMGTMPPANMNMPPQQQYPTTDYNNYQAVPPQQNTSYCQNVNAQYSTPYNNQPTYSSYPMAGAYDQSVDYSTAPAQQTNVDPYGYSKPVDSYGYTNTSYAPQQTGYEDYSTGGYVDQSGYATTVQDPSYGQTVGTYPAYSY